MDVEIDYEVDNDYILKIISVAIFFVSLPFSNNNYEEFSILLVIYW